MKKGLITLVALYIIGCGPSEQKLQNKKIDGLNNVSIVENYKQIEPIIKQPITQYESEIYKGYDNPYKSYQDNMIVELDLCDKITSTYKEVQDLNIKHDKNYTVEDIIDKNLPLSDTTIMKPYQKEAYQLIIRNIKDELLCPKMEEGTDILQ